MMGEFLMADSTEDEDDALSGLRRFSCFCVVAAICGFIDLLIQKLYV